jgi:hypothetical protein
MIRGYRLKNGICFQVFRVAQSQTLTNHKTLSQLTTPGTWALCQALPWCSASAMIIREWNLLSPRRLGPLTTMPFTAQTPYFLMFLTGPYQTLHHPCGCLLPRHCGWVSQGSKSNLFSSPPSISVSNSRPSLKMAPHYSSLRYSPYFLVWC